MQCTGAVSFRGIGGIGNFHSGAQSSSLLYSISGFAMGSITCAHMAIRSVDFENQTVDVGIGK